MQRRSGRGSGRRKSERRLRLRRPGGRPRPKWLTGRLRLRPKRPKGRPRRVNGLGRRQRGTEWRTKKGRRQRHWLDDRNSLSSCHSGKSL